MGSVSSKLLSEGTYLSGVNSRGIRKALKPLLGEEHLSKSAVSRVVSRLKERFEEWQNRTLSEEVYAIVYLDGFHLPWCTTPIEAESSLGPDSHHPIISLSGIPSAVMVLRILHPILASTLCAANPLARIAEPTIAL